MTSTIVARFYPSSQRGGFMAAESAAITKIDHLDTDVIVVGAGPSGCAAAYDLATAGIRVLLVDKTEFPRKKSCAGGLTVKAVRALPYPISPIIQKTVRNLMVSCRMRHRKVLTSMDPVCYMVERSAFDDFCLKKTTAAGARFAVVRSINRVVETPRGISLIANGDVIRARFLIGADGVYSRIRRLTGRFKNIRFGFAVEGIVEPTRPFETTMGFDFNQVDGGYGWVFPKEEHINVGLYTTRPDVSIKRQDLADYTNLRIGSPSPRRVAGYPLGMGGWRYRPGRGRVLLVGDAAGFVDPLLGEGLYHAITSGQQAAAAIRDALFDGNDAAGSYAQALMPIQANLLFSHLAAIWFYRLPTIGHLLLLSPAASNPLMKGFSLGMSLLDIFRNGHRFWLDKPIPV